MKFLCDRCKTRYSIADERVRGKILKIRCKNCSNVITVREGMAEPDGEPIAPSSAEAARRIPRATDHAPTVMAAVKSPLQQAFAQVMTAAPPAPQQLEEEWYVSIDGDQQGPFTLVEAQGWISARRGDDELYCWCEGFDDWLPVEKVSHFRGLRGRPALATPAAGVRKVASATTPAPAIPARPPAQEEEPKPLFAATLAQLEADVAGEKPAPLKEVASGNGSAAPRRDTVPDPAGSTGPTAAVRLPAPARATPASSAPPVAALGAAVAPSASARPAAGLPPPRPATTPPRVADAPAATPAPPPIPVLGRATPATGAPPLRSAGALFDRSDELGGVPPEPAPEPPALSTARAAVDDDDDDGGGFDDDLAIGEVSRVVRLTDIAAASRRPPAGAAAPAARRTRAVAAVGGATGAADVIAAGADEPPSALAVAASEALHDDHSLQPVDGAAALLVPPAQPARRSHTVVYVVGGVALLALVALVIVFAAGGGADADGDQVAGVGNDFTDLGRTIDDPRYVGKGTAAATGVGTSGTTAGTGRATGRRPGTSAATGTTPGTAGGTGAGTGKVEVVIGADGRPLVALTPDDVLTVAGKMSSGTQRCYSRALKDDPFLKVTSVKALISIDRAGKVKSVSLDSMSGHALGQCIIAAIQRWPFRASTAGIDTQITLKFQQGGI